MDGLQCIFHLGLNQAQVDAYFSKAFLCLGRVCSEGCVIDELLEFLTLPEQMILDALTGLSIRPNLEGPERDGVVPLYAL